MHQILTFKNQTYMESKADASAIEWQLWLYIIAPFLLDTRVCLNEKVYV